MQYFVLRLNIDKYFIKYLRLYSNTLDYDSHQMITKQSLADSIVRCISKVCGFIINIGLNMLIVKGGTMTTLTTALVAYCYKVKVGQVVEGLRTYNRYSHIA